MNFTFVSIIFFLGERYADAELCVAKQCVHFVLFDIIEREGMEKGE